jgi:DNA end-binding protein Ku
LPAEGLKGAGVTAKEVELAKRLVSDMAGHWKPTEFTDTYHQDLMRRINEKIKKGETKQITEPDASDTEKPRSAQVIDLAALLQQSLKGGSRATTRSNAADASAAKPARKASVHVAARTRAVKSAATPKRKRA